MYRGFCIGYGGVDVDFASDSEAVGFAIRGAEETDVVGYLSVFLVENDIVLISFIVSSRKIIGWVFDTHEACLRQ